MEAITENHNRSKYRDNIVGAEAPMYTSVDLLHLCVGEHLRRGDEIVMSQNVNLPLLEMVA